MKSQIQKISQISPDQSVVCILGSDQIPEKLKLSKQENDFAKRQIRPEKKMISLIPITDVFILSD